MSASGAWAACMRGRGAGGMHEWVRRGRASCACTDERCTSLTLYGNSQHVLINEKLIVNLDGKNEKQMDGWMRGWLVGLVDGWMDGQMGGCRSIGKQC
eukprot:158793-Chlamydomonas_euryale.AAC.12